MTMTELLTRNQDRYLATAGQILDTADAENRDLTQDEQRMVDDAMNRARTIAEEIRNTPGDLDQRTRRAVVRQDQNLDAGSDSGAEHRTLDDINRQVRSLRIGSDPVELPMNRSLTTVGQEAIPTGASNNLYTHLVQSTVMFDAGQIFQTDEGYPMLFPRTTNDSTADLVAEGAVIPSSDPSLGALTLGAYKYGYMVNLTSEMVDDVTFNLASFLTTTAGRVVGRRIGNDLVNGDGTGKPSGIVPSTASAITLAAATPDEDELIDLFYSLAPQYRANASWLMNDMTAGAVRKLKDNDGRFLWTEGLAGAPATILGRPVLIDPAMPTGAGEKTVLFGDLKTYYIRQAGGFRIERSTDFKFDQDMVSYRVLFRVDGGLIDVTGSVKAATAAA